VVAQTVRIAIVTAVDGDEQNIKVWKGCTKYAIEVSQDVMEILQTDITRQMGVGVEKNLCVSSVMGGSACRQDISVGCAGINVYPPLTNEYLLIPRGEIRNVYYQ